jgi:hypothetical protein
MMTEKEAIEKAGVDAFVSLHNERYGSSFRVAKMGDAPDAELVDASGDRLLVEVTTTEDRVGDTQAALGRSRQREVLTEVGDPKELERNTSVVTLVERITAKLNKRYGGPTVLLIRDTSGVDWDWEGALKAPAAKDLDLTKVRTTFGGGVFILSRDRLTLHKLA